MPSKLPSKLWPNGIIHYEIGPSLKKVRPIIRNAMNHIELNTCIRFIELRKPQYYRNYVYLTNDNGCHSVVGRSRRFERQILSLDDGCHDIGSILHELCHSIGLHHEHTRYDRDRYLNIKWENIYPDMFDQFEKIPESVYKPVHQFDYNSIMIYGSDSFSKNGKKTIVPKNKVEIYESYSKYRLSRGDIANINGLYNCKYY